MVFGAYRAEDDVVGAGTVSVYRGVGTDWRPGGPPFTATGADPDWLVEGLAPYDRFGGAAALVPDLDGDGFADLFGLASFGSRWGVEAGVPYSMRTRSLAPAPLELPGVAAGHGFGRAAVVLDVDGDGFDDLLVGGPGTGGEGVGGNAGAVYVHAGGPTGFAPAAVMWAGVPPTHSGSDRFGDTLAVGDLDGDGYRDLLVGARGDSRPSTWGSTVVGEPACGGLLSGAGAVFGFRGGPDGVAVEPSWVVYGPEDGGGVHRLASGFDADGDGRDDLAFGGPDTWGVGGGYAVVRGRAADPAGLTVICDAELRLAVDTFDRLGDALAALGDLDGDGCDEIGVGATGEEPADATFNQGTVRVVWGSGPGCRAPAQTTFTVDVIGTGLGAAVAPAGDLDGDGLADLLAGGAEYRVAFAERGVAWVSPGTQWATAPTEPVGVWSDAVTVASPLLPIQGLAARYGLVGADAASRFGAAVAVVEGPDGSLVAVGQPVGSAGGNPRGGGVTLHRFDAADGLEVVPWGLVAGEEGHEGGLGDRITAVVIDGRPALIVGAPTSSAAGLDVGAVLVVAP